MGGLIEVRQANENTDSVFKSYAVIPDHLLRKDEHDRFEYYQPEQQGGTGAGAVESELRRAPREAAEGACLQGLLGELKRKVCLRGLLGESRRGSCRVGA